MHRMAFVVLPTHPSGCVAWTEWGSRSETGPRLFVWETGQQDRVRYNLPNECGRDRVPS